MQQVAKWLAMLALPAFIGACATAPMQPAETIGPNNPAAMAGIRAAWTKAAEQKSFRARMTSESGGKISESTIEFSAPASVHMVMKTQNMEQIVVDGAHYMRSDGRWARLPIATGGLIEQLRKDPATIAALERSISGASIVGPNAVAGKPATMYRYYQKASLGGGLASSSGWVTLWVGANGLPLKIESDGVGRVLGFSTQSKSTIVYDEYGVPVRIVAPL
ncbi:MAG: hypothetical protein ABIS68_04550 [Casimicrobiaceae bacterium]